jgi:protein SCO1
MTFKTIIKNPFLWAFVIGIISLHIFRELSIIRKSAPPPLMIVPDWSLTDQNGQKLSKQDLKGSVVVAAFFFTSCPTICPKLTAAMKEVYERFKHNPKTYFLSITVDPEVDSPEVLKQYLQKNGINYDNWSALSGTKAEVYDVVMNKMKVHVGEREAIHGTEGMYDIPHLAQLALFDQNGDLRGLFKADSVELSALVRAMQFFLEAK